MKTNEELEAEVDRLTKELEQERQKNAKLSEEIKTLEQQATQMAKMGRETMCRR